MQGTSTNRLQSSLVNQLRRGLFVPILVLILGLVLSFAVGLYASFNQQRLGEQKVAVQSDLDSILSTMVDQETGVRGYITTNNADFLQPFTSGRPQYLASLQHLKDETRDGSFASTASALPIVEQRASDWYTNFALVQIQNMQSGDLTTPRSDATSAFGKGLFDQFRASVNQLQQVVDHDLANLQSQTNTIDVVVFSIIALFTALVLVLLWRTFLQFTNRMRMQLGILQETTSQLGAGDLTARVRGLSDPELRQLGDTFNTMADSLQEQQGALKDRDVLENVLQLNNLLTSSLDLKELTQEFIQKVLTLLDLQVGALYLYDVQQKHLSLFSAAGLSQQELQTSFQLGEGLVGRAAQNRESLYLAQKQSDESVPFQVKTMVGTVLPAGIYQLPLLQGNRLLGVLSVGSVYTMNENARNVLNVVASNLAAAISNTQAFQHIQEQADELARRSREQEHANIALRRQRDDLTILNSALEEANRVRSQFLSTMSHELRTPLTSIIGFSQILLRKADGGNLNKRQTSNIERILKNGQHLLSLINDVLDLAKIEAGHMDVNYGEVNLQDLLTNVVEETQSIAFERGLTLTAQVDERISTVETDPMKLRQILLNLISNGLKFTQKGEVSITATPIQSSHKENNGDGQAVDRIAIAVRDTGIGISQEMQSSIFEAFYQIDSSSARKYGGTGLGLSIVRQLVTLLGGTLDVQSTPEQGSTFTLFLPVHARRVPSIGQNVRLNGIQMQQRGTSELDFSSSDVSQDGVTGTEKFLVLAIDDNPDVLELIKTSLENSPYDVVSVNDPTKAVAMVQNLQPSAVTLDVMMPKYNGWQILHELKSNPKTASIPVIMLTVLEDRSAGYVLGADEYLVKPVERNMLLETLRRFVRQRTTVTPYENVAITNPVQARSHQIVVVDDETSTLTIVERMLSEEGFTVRMVPQGQETLELIQHAEPDVVILHLVMPSADTSSLLRRLDAIQKLDSEHGTFDDEQGKPLEE